MDTCVFIMAKYPAVGEVKTRLGESMGNEEAAHLYLCFLRDTVKKVRELGVPFFVYYTPDDRLKEFQILLGDDLSYVPQVGADLGERLFNGFKISAEMGHTSAIALASDAPDLPASILDEAVNKLEEFDLVLGPSPDWGYYLIGLKGDAAILELFQGIIWSTDTVYAETMARINENKISCHSFAPWADVDHVDDLERLLSSSDPGFRMSHAWKYLRGRRVNPGTARAGCCSPLTLIVLSVSGLCSRVSVSRCMETAKNFSVTIDEEQCKGCLICVHVCESRGGKILKESDKKTALGGTLPVVDGDCIGCRWCERYCPDFALNVEELQDA